MSGLDTTAVSMLASTRYNYRVEHTDQGICVYVVTYMLTAWPKHLLNTIPWFHVATRAAGALLVVAVL